MPSTTPANNKKAKLPREVAHGNQFTKDWERFNKAGRSDMARLKQLMSLLTNNDGPMDAEWKDHPLHGQWKDHYGPHIHGDFILVYRLKGNTITFVRIGTHSELYK